MMASAQSMASAILVLFLASGLTQIDSFSPTATRHAVAVGVSRPSATVGTTPSLRTLKHALRMAEEDAEQQASEDVEEDEEAAGEQAEEEEEEEPEDPEVTKLKEEIASLESTIKSKRNDLNSVVNLADQYTENGYARKVAELQNVRARRNTAFANNAFSAKAGVIETFIPVLDELISVDEKYEGNEFATKYSALRGNFNTALKELGVTEYTAEVGTKVDLARVVAVSEEYSESNAKGTVISPTGMGMELEGNVIRPAECVASLGSEAEAKKAEEEAAAKAEAEAKAAAEAEAEAESSTEEEEA